MAMQYANRMPKMPPAPALISPDRLTPFIEPLPVPPLARSSGKRPIAKNSSIRLPYFRLPICEMTCKVHPEVPATRWWSYGNSIPGPTIETRSGEGVLVEWPNELPENHFLPIDHKLMGAEADKPEVRTVVHLHGAKAPPVSDGYPENWYTPGKSLVYHYPNEQDAALLWYHDHAMGINRLNIYAGMLGLYIVRDPAEEALHLPKGEYEVPLVIFDRLLRTDGQLYYPVSQRPEAPWVPEVFGNAFLVNGKLLPYLEVEPRRYRFRILNGANGRFYHLSLANGQSFHQIGTDQGLLGAPVELREIALAPAERADVIIDFADHKGEQIVLHNDLLPVMQFRVGRESKGDDSVLPQTLRAIPRLAESAAVKTRLLTLDEYDNMVDEPMVHLLNGSRWHDPITEKPVLGTTEIWAFANMTDDVHPIHLHLVRFQLLDRQSFDVNELLYNKRLQMQGRVYPPAPEEAGWKDTVRATPGAVTRIIVPFEGYAGRYVWHCHILEHEDNARGPRRCRREGDVFGQAL
jgi:spore coat protein A